MQWLEEGERPTKYFCALENKNFLNKTIKKINHNDNILTDQQEILKHVKQYYSVLFQNKDATLEETDLNMWFLKILQ